MPVINFEYTANLNIEKKIKNFIKEMHEALVEIIKTDLYTCRSMITPHDKYFIGDGDNENAFMQLSVRILPGRDKAIKDKLGNELLTIMQKTFSDESGKLNTQMRVYLTEVEIDCYYGLTF